MEQGNSYILVKDRLARHVRKVMLEESNGLFFLLLEMEGGNNWDGSFLNRRAHLAAAAKKMLSDTKRLYDTAVRPGLGTCSVGASLCRWNQEWIGLTKHFSNKGFFALRSVRTRHAPCTFIRQAV